MGSQSARVAIKISQTESLNRNSRSHGSDGWKCKVRVPTGWASSFADCCLLALPRGAWGWGAVGRERVRWDWGPPR